MYESHYPREHGHGHKQTPEAKARRLSGAHPVSAAQAYALRSALRAFLPPTFNQSRTSTCFAHAQASLITVGCTAAGTPLLWIPSPLGIARNTYCEEQTDPTVPLQDVGADMGDVMISSAREGVRAMGPLAPGARYSDVTPENIVLRSTLADDESSARALVLGPEQLQPSAGDFLAQIATSIDNLQCGVSIGLHSTPQLEAWFDSPARTSSGGYAAFGDVTGFTGDDGHDVACTDYVTEADGSLSFWCRSSWGPGGDDGGIWIAGAWLAQGGCTEAWRMKVAVRSAVQVAA